jgi:hypothetical protein
MHRFETACEVWILCLLDCGSIVVRIHPFRMECSLINSQGKGAYECRTLMGSWLLCICWHVVCVSMGGHEVAKPDIIC